MTEIWIVITALFLSAFFSSCEIVFTSFDKIKLLVWRKKSKIYTKSIDIFFPRQERFITTTLIGNNLANVIYSSIITIYLVSQGIQQWVVILIAAVVLLTAGEIIPKTIALTYADRMVKPYSIVLRLFYYLFYIAAEFLSFIIKGIFRDSKSGHMRLLTKEKLWKIIRSEQKKHLPEKAEMVEGLYAFSFQKVRELMTPRTELTAASIDSSPEDIKRMVMATGHSKIVIYEDDIEQIKGYIHHLDLLNGGGTVKEMLRPVGIVSEYTPAVEALKILRSKKTGILVAIDEYGGVGGIVTIEDIIEELFGEIEDEHDRPRFRYRKIQDNSLLLSGRTEIDELNREFSLDIEKEEGVKTIGGWLITLAGYIPKPGEEFQFHGFHIKIIRASDRMVKLFTMKLPERRKNEE